MRHLLIAYSIVAFGSNGAGTWFGAFFIRTHDLTLTEVGAALGLIAGVSSLFGTLLGALATPWLVRRDRRWELWLPGLVYAAIVPAYMFLFYSNDIRLVYLALGFTSFAAAATVGAILSAMQSVLPAHLRAMGMALSMFAVSFVGAGAGPLLVGWTSDLLAPQLGTDSLRYALILGVAVMTCGIAHFFLAAKHQRRDLVSYSARWRRTPFSGKRAQVAIEQRWEHAGRLVGDEVSHPWDLDELAGRIHVLPGTLGRRTPHRLVPVPPDVEHRHRDRRNVGGLQSRAPDCPIPVDRGVEGVAVTEGSEIGFRIPRRNAGARKHGSQPCGAVRQQLIRRLATQEGPVVSRPGRLPGIAAHRRGERRGVRPRDDRERPYPVRVGGCRHPGEMSSPVVTHEVKTFPPEGIRHRQDIADQQFDPIRVHPGRTGAGRVSPLVRGAGAQTGLRERQELRAPGVPGLRKAVQEQH